MSLRLTLQRGIEAIGIGRRQRLEAPQDPMEAEERAHLKRIGAAAQPAFEHLVRLPDSIKSLVSLYLSPQECAQTVIRVNKAWRNGCLALYDWRKIVKEVEDLQSYLLKNDKAAAKKFETFCQHASREFSSIGDAPLSLQNFEKIRDRVELNLFNSLVNQNDNEESLKKLIALILRQPHPRLVHRSLVSVLSIYKTMRQVLSVVDASAQSRQLYDMATNLLERGTSPDLVFAVATHVSCEESTLSLIYKKIIAINLKKGEIGISMAFLVLYA